jgi:hypothetical protein
VSCARFAPLNGAEGSAEYFEDNIRTVEEPTEFISKAPNVGNDKRDYLRGFDIKVALAEVMA